MYSHAAKPYGRSGTACNDFLSQDVYYRQSKRAKTCGALGLIHHSDFVAGIGQLSSFQQRENATSKGTASCLAPSIELASSNEPDMTDLSPDVNAVLKAHNAPLVLSHRYSIDNLDGFIKEAYSIVSLGIAKMTTLQGLD